MPFNGVMNTQQLTTLTAALDGFCKTAAIEPGTDEFDEARYLIMSLYRTGGTSAEALTAACREPASTRNRTPSAWFAKRLLSKLN